jgi:hypothetical protein
MQWSAARTHLVAFRHDEGGDAAGGDGGAHGEALLISVDPVGGLQDQEMNI